MAYQWQTVEQAAVMQGISTRTIARRIAQGKLETRLLDGRREVLICVEDAPAEVAETAAVESPEVATAEAQAYVSYAQGTLEPEGAEQQVTAYPTYSDEDGVHEAALVLAEDRAHRAEMTLTIFQQSVNLAASEARRARINSRFAWGTVAAMAAAVTVAVGWTASRVTQAQFQADSLRDRMVQMSDANDKVVQERDQYRATLDKTAQDKARVEGRLEEIQGRAELAAAEVRQTREELRLVKAELPAARTAPPATQPNSIMEKIAGLMMGN